MRHPQYSLLALLLLASCQQESVAATNPEVTPNATAKLVLEENPWGGCVAAVRGALLKLPGVARVSVQAGKKEFTVDYDRAKVKPEDFVAPLAKVGHPATLLGE